MDLSYRPRPLDAIRADAKRRAGVVVSTILGRLGNLRDSDDALARRVLEKSLEDELFAMYLERERTLESLTKLHQESQARIAELARLEEAFKRLRIRTDELNKAGMLPVPSSPPPVWPTKPKPAGPVGRLARALWRRFGSKI